MGQITEVVKHLILINIIFFLGTAILMPDTWPMLAMYYPTSEAFRPYQIVTHMFMHANLSHLAFNMLSLFFLGPWVERTLGPKRFLILYFLSGFGALLLHMIFRYYVISIMGDVSSINVPVLGASGAVYGVVVGFGYLFPNAQLMLLFPPIPIRAKYLAIGMVALDLIFGFSGTQSGVAHFAHVGGAITGFLVLYFWKNKR